MRQIAHISDVHFGREEPRLVKALLAALHEIAPDVIVVSGDLTQRARVSQFEAARRFLDALPEKPLLVVPGNHDISATNLVRRFTRPLGRYRRLITRELSPFLEDEELAVAGINTARSLTRKDGRINRRQVDCACDRLSGMREEVVRVVVTHHPIDLPMEDRHNALVGRARLAMSEFAACRVDLFLSGHLHTGQTVTTSARYGIEGHSAIVAQAGTAVSTRTRGEANSWNLIRVERGAIAIGQMVWDEAAGSFGRAGMQRFRKDAAGWTPERN